MSLWNQVSGDQLTARLSWNKTSWCLIFLGGWGEGNEKATQEEEEERHLTTQLRGVSKRENAVD